MTDTSDTAEELDPRLVTWVGEVIGTDALEITRHTGGASRAGYAVDAHLPDGTTRELWLRTDPGFGPQSATLYSLRREAAVYRGARSRHRCWSPSWSPCTPTSPRS